MKPKVIVYLAAAGAALLLTGAAAIEAVDQFYVEPRTVSSVREIYERYLGARESVPPLPMAKSPLELIVGMESGDFSFLDEHWYINQPGSSLYVAEGSKLAKTLKLPLEIMAIEDITRGEITLFSREKNGQWKGLALFAAPPVLDESDPYWQALSDVEKEMELLIRFGAARVRWSAVLKPEADALGDLILQRDAVAATALLLEEDGAAAMMSVPAEYTDDLWLCLETQTNGINLNVFAPEGFTNRVEIYSCADLVSNIWSIAVQNLYPSGTNPAVWDAGGPAVRFYAAGNMDIDTDSDGIPDAREKFIYKTDPGDPDSDGDGMPDGWELQYGFNPVYYADGGFDFDSDDLNNADEYLNGTYPNDPDSEDDGMPDGWEVAGGLNPLVDDTSGDPDGDSVNNLAEYTGGTHPQIANVTLPAGATGSLVFRYDEDGRLTESHLNNTSSELYTLTPAHNVTNLNVFATE